MKNLILRQSRDFGDILSATFTYLRLHFKTLGKGLLFFSLPVIIISGVLIGSGFGDSFAASEAGLAEPEALGAFFFKFFSGLILLMLTFVVITQIVFKHMQLVDEGVEDIDVNMLLEDFSRNFFGLIGIYFVIGVASSIGFLLFIIPGFFVSVKLSLAPAIYIIEEEDFGEALSRSWEVTRDYWWFTFGVNIVVSIIVNFASNIVIFPMYIIMMVVVFASGEPDMNLFGTLFSIMYGLSMITVGLLYCIPVISQALVYFNLDERKSGATLTSKIDSLAGNN